MVEGCSHCVCTCVFLWARWDEIKKKDGVGDAKITEGIRDGSVSAKKGHEEVGTGFVHCVMIDLCVCVCVSIRERGRGEGEGERLSRVTCMSE